MQDEAGHQVSSIECLDTAQSHLFKLSVKGGSAAGQSDEPAAWRLIQVPISRLAQRCYPVVATLSEAEVVILGGYDSNQLVGDAVIFNAETEQCEKVVASDTSMEFYAFGN